MAAVAEIAISLSEMQQSLIAAAGFANLSSFLPCFKKIRKFQLDGNQFNMYFTSCSQIQNQGEDSPAALFKGYLHIV